ncbi:LOW QUALITY PROTEIN: myb-like protein X [Argopecten irradians]|uniref:LOW QUALITY PROTEIN: myb-like protein X n=1 Tax=Argopecten irradians TaxID=31199 RepID=UPI00371281D0
MDTENQLNLPGESPDEKEKLESTQDLGGDKGNPEAGKDNSVTATSNVKAVKKKKIAFQAPNTVSTTTNNVDVVDKSEKIKEKKPKKSKQPAQEKNADSVEKPKDEKIKEKKPKKNKEQKENLDGGKDEKPAKKKKPKQPGEKQKDAESKELKPKKIKKSITKKTESEAKEFDSNLKDLENVEKDSMKECNDASDSQALEIEPVSTICNKNDIAKDSEEQEQKEVQKKENVKEPAKSLTDEEWEHIFQSAIDHVMNTPLDQLKQEDEEMVVSETTAMEDEVPEEECDTMDVEDGPPVVRDVTVSNDKPSVSPVLILENSLDHNVPIVDQQIRMLECAEVQELNENTPEGSELEFNGEEEKKHQRTPVVQIKKAVKKADRSSAAKVLAPRQLQFPKPIKNTETQRKKKEKKNDKTEKSKTVDVVKKKEKKKGFPENNQKITDYLPKSKKQLLMEREIEETGTWVQCSNTTCQKWRFLGDINDPTEIDEKWTCKMNTDATYNSCDKKEQDYDESEHFYNQISEGSIVWARMVGYPWWPAMVEIDPDTSYFEQYQKTMFPSNHYHVVYLDNKVSRAWVKASAILPFHRGGEDLNKNLFLTKKSKGPNFKKEVDAARVNALTALELPTKERLKQFSFSARYKGKWAEEESSISKVKKHYRVKLTPKKSKNKPKKPKECSVGKSVENQDLEMYMLDSTMVDEMLSEEPDSILKGIEDVLDSLGSDVLSDDNDGDYVPTNSEREVFTESTETKTEASPSKKSKDMKRQNTSKHEEKPVLKKPKKHKSADETKKGSGDKKEKVKKSKRKDGNSNDSLVKKSLESLEIKTEVCNVSGTVTCDKNDKEENMTNSTTITTIEFDSDIFTMELDEGESDGNAKEAKKSKSSAKGSVPVTPDRKELQEAKPYKKKSKKSLFAVPEVIPTNITPEENSKNSSDEKLAQKDNFPAKHDVLENTLLATSETSEEIPKEENENCVKIDDTKISEQTVNKSSKKKACSKKVSFSAPATVPAEPKVMPVQNKAHHMSCSDEQTVPDVQTQESEHEDEFSLDLPVCEQKHEVQEINVMAVSTLPVAVDIEDAYDSDPFDLMEE